MKRLAIGPLHYEYSRHAEVRLRVEPGETFVVETEDAFSGQIRGNHDRRDRKTVPCSNPQTGPIWVEGAQCGDALAVTIGQISPLIGQCATRTGSARELSEWLGTDCPHGVHVCPIRDNWIHWSDSIKIPYQPMLGCIGTAPAWGSPTTLPAGPHGGNMDLVEVCPGNTVFLPVFVEGAYLYLGDAHAAMGHGELSANGLEMPAQTTITINLVQDAALVLPRIESLDEIMAVATGCPLERSVGRAFAELILWMETAYGWNRWLAYDLLTHVGRISVGHFATGTAAAKIEKKYLRPPP